MPRNTTPRHAFDALQSLASVDVQVTSPDEWDRIAVSRLKLHSMDVELPQLGAQMVAINCGKAFDVLLTSKGETWRGRSYPGHAVLYPPDAESRWAFEGDGDCITAFISQNLIDDLAEETGWQLSQREIQPKFLFHDVIIARLLRDLLHEAQRDHGGCRTHIDALAINLVFHLFHDYAAGNHKARRIRHPIAPWRLKRVMEFIEAHHADNLSLLDMAQIAEMSLYHFAKSFQATTGMSPHHYLTIYRLRKACDLLEDGRMPIGNIARQIGLHNQSYFSQLFSRHIGMTPRRFRIMQRG